MKPLNLIALCCTVAAPLAGGAAAAASPLAPQPGYGEASVGVTRAGASGDYGGGSNGVMASFLAVGRRGQLGLGATFNAVSFSAVTHNPDSTGFAGDQDIHFDVFATELLACRLAYGGGLNVCGGPGHAFAHAGQGASGRTYGAFSGILRASSEIAEGCGVFAEYLSSMPYLAGRLSSDKQTFAYSSLAAGMSYWLAPSE